MTIKFLGIWNYITSDVWYIFYGYRGLHTNMVLQAITLKMIASQLFTLSISFEAVVSHSS